MARRKKKAKPEQGIRCGKCGRVIPFGAMRNHLSSMHPDDPSTSLAKHHKDSHRAVVLSGGLPSLGKRR